MKKYEWFFEIAKTAAKKSKDRSTKVGCAIIGPKDEVRALGYNGFVRGANDDIPEWHKRPLKYELTNHAEANAIANAARIGASLDGCRAFVTLPPCSKCALLLVQSGIKEVNFLVPFDKPEWIERWGENFKYASLIMRSGGVLYLGYSGVWADDSVKISVVPSMTTLDVKAREVEIWLTNIEGLADKKCSICNGSSVTHYSFKYFGYVCQKCETPSSVLE